MPSFIKHGPDIPVEVLQSLEDGNLIFFCGAGVSKCAGLPLFDGLINELYARLHEEKTHLESTAFDKKEFDRVLTLLERRIDPKVVRSAIASTFDELFNDNLKAHINLLTLSKTPENTHRLVTTNFDDLFNKAGCDVDHTDAAPRLPNPKRKSWRSVVHVHGRLKDPTDFDFENLVLNTEDFGQAYMLDGWATKFVVDLFRRFDVVFVGYSLNDPVMRYMMDALAAARSQGEGFKYSYAFVAAQQDEFAAVHEEWNARDVVAIPYALTANHNLLYDTLNEWAELHSEGLMSKRRMALRNADTPPADTEDPIGKLVTWALSDPSGKIAQAFADMDPVPPFGWLTHIENAKLLGITENTTVGKKVANVLASPMAGADVIALAKPTHQIARWLSLHIADPNFIRWVISKGTVLHSDLRRLISNELERRDDIPIDIHEFWSIVTSEVFSSLLNRKTFGWFFSEQFSDEVKAADLRRFSELLRLVPNISIYDFIWNDTFPDTGPNTDSKDNAEQSQIWRVLNVDLEFLSNDASSHILEKVKENGPLLIALLPSLTNNLLEGWDWFSAFHRMEDNEDHSQWDMPSISAHAQNREFKDWAKIVTILRDGIIALSKQDFHQAKRIIEFWGSINYPIFQRLYIFCLVEVDGFLRTTDLRAYLERHPYLLASHSANREILRLFRKQGQAFNQETLTYLCEEIGRGLNRDNYTNMDEHEWADMSERHVCLRLAKLKIGNATLPENARNRLNEYAMKHPGILSTDVRDEFSVWSSEGPFEWDKPLYRAGDLRTNTSQEIIQLLTEAVDNIEQHKRKDPWSVIADLSIEQPSKAIRILMELGKSGSCIPNVISTTLNGFEKLDQQKICASHWRYAGRAILTLHDQCLIQDLWGATRWLRSATPDYVSVVTSTAWWAIWDRLWALCLINTIDEAIQDNGERWVGAAINNPAGILTETFLAHLWSQKFETGSSLPNEYVTRFNSMLDGDSYAHKLTRVILASRLPQLFKLDPTWASERFIPLMQWGAKDETPGLWQGYLWAPRLGADFLACFKDVLLSALRHSSDIGGTSGRNLRRLFTFACIETPDGFSNEEIQMVLRDFSADELSNVAHAFSSHLQNSGDAANDQWSKRIKPFFLKHWPVDEDHKSEKTTNALADMSLKAGNEFEDVVETIKPHLIRVNQHGRLPYHFKTENSPHVQDYPDTVLELLFRTVSSEVHETYGLRKVLDQLIELKPHFTQDLRYQYLDRLA